MDELEGFELVGQLAWKVVLAAVNKSRKEVANRGGLAAQGKEQNSMPRLAIGARQGDARAEWNK